MWELKIRFVEISSKIFGDSIHVGKSAKLFLKGSKKLTCSVLNKQNPARLLNLNKSTG